MKIALITGAASGIGLELSRIYLQNHIVTLLVDNNLAKLEQESSVLQRVYPDLVRVFPCDVTDFEQVKQLANSIKSEFGRIDYLYNNAGIVGSMAPVWELSPQQLAKVIDVNLFGMHHILNAMMPMLLEQTHESHIINVGSLYSLCNTSQTGAYSISKHAVLALSETLYFDLKHLEKPIHVSVVFPSFTDTSLLVPKTMDANPFHDSLQHLLTHSRAAHEVAEHIVRAVDAKQFYVFPDLEVKSYCDERTRAILEQNEPCMHAVEKIMGALIRRAARG